MRVGSGQRAMVGGRWSVRLLGRSSRLIAPLTRPSPHESFHEIAYEIAPPRSSQGTLLPPQATRSLSTHYSLLLRSSPAASSLSSRRAPNTASSPPPRRARRSGSALPSRCCCSGRCYAPMWIRPPRPSPTSSAPRPSRRSLSTHYSLLLLTQDPTTARRPPPTAHYPPPTTHHPSPTTHRRPPTTHHPPPTTHHPPLTAHHPPA